MADFQAKALYDYSTDDCRLLSFNENDLFMILAPLSKDPNWYYAATTEGQAGFVPVTYMQKTELVNNQEAFLRYVEKVFEALKETAAANETGYSALYALQKQALKRLRSLADALKERISLDGNRDRLPVCKEASSGRSSPGNFLTDYLPQLNTEWISESLLMGDEASLVDLVTPTTNKNSSQNVLSALAADVVEQVRGETQLSHNLSRVAVCTVVRCIAKHLGGNGSCEWQHLIDAVINSDCAVTPTGDGQKSLVMVTSHDGERLRSIFSTLWDAKNDSQQRSWPIQEDESTITALLEELYTILVDADPRVCLQAIQANGYDCVNTLALYYQMEPRSSLRVWMLRVFLTVCELDIAAVDLLLHSVLPMELARDLQTSNDDIERTKYTLLLLTVIFSTGERPPTDVNEYIGEDFIAFLLNQIESADVEEEVLELLVGALLSINLCQVHKPAASGADVLISVDEPPSMVMQVLKKRHDARALTQKLMLLINREDDPTKVLRHHNEQPNSVLKLLVELFSDSNTAELFYLNDVIVLIEIVARQLSDLTLGDSRRVWYLRLMRNILDTVSAYEGQRAFELRKCFHVILTTDECPQKEVALVQGIVRRHSKWFGLE